MDSSTASSDTLDVWSRRPSWNRSRKNDPVVTLSFSGNHRHKRMAVTLDPYETSTETFSDVNRYMTTDSDAQAHPEAKGGRSSVRKMTTNTMTRNEDRKIKASHDPAPGLRQ